MFKRFSWSAYGLFLVTTIYNLQNIHIYLYLCFSSSWLFIDTIFYPNPHTNNIDILLVSSH